MPELPDVELYIAKLRERVLGQPLIEFKPLNLFVLRSVSPSPRDIAGLKMESVSRLGKRIVLALEDDIFLVIHLMIAGRLRWFDDPATKGVGGKLASAYLLFPNGKLFLTEAGSKKRASITLVRGSEALAALDPGGIDVFSCSFESFKARLQGENHTLKRSLTSPQLFSGIGNAYSDEILHAARLSPVKQTRTLTDEEIERLLGAARRVLWEWTERLQKQFEDKFPGAGDVTAFRPEFAVHGKFGQPCPVCGKPVQRICYADNEVNYCAVCQNEGRILADRALSRLLGSDWPRSFEDA